MIQPLRVIREFLTRHARRKDLIPRSVASAAILLITCLAHAAVTVEMFEANQVIDSPIQPMDLSAAEAALNSARASYDPLYLDQLAEAQVDWVRNLVAKGANPGAIRSALDQIAAWSKKERPLREQAANINALENRARSAPSDVALRVAIARYWVRQLELERDEIPSDRPRMFRVWVKTRTWECNDCYVKRGPRETRSNVFPRAEAAVQSALAAGPNDPGALFAASQLWSMMFEEPLGTAEAKSIDFARRAAMQQGPEAAAARIYVLERDNQVAKLEERVGQLRGAKAIGSVPVWTAFNNGRRDPAHDAYKPVFRNASPQESSEAEATEQKARALAGQQRAELESSVAQNPLSADVFRVLAEWPPNLNTDAKERMEKERILRYAILLDPTDWRLHWERAANWNALAQPKMEAAAANFQAFLRTKADTNFIPLYDVARDQLEPDRFSEYVIALQAVRREPSSPFAHQRLSMALRDIVGQTIGGLPELPDAANRVAAEVKLTYYAALRHLDHPEDWRDAQTKAATEQLISWAKAHMSSPLK